MAVYAEDTLQSPASLKAFVTAAFADGDKMQAFIEAINPVMYETLSGTEIAHVIVDGHAWDNASLAAVAKLANGNVAVAITDGSSLTIA